MVFEPELLFLFLLLSLFLKGMTGALAPFSYLVNLSVCPCHFHPNLLTLSF